MKLASNIALALSLSLAGGAALGGTALAEHRDDYDQDAADDFGKGNDQGWQGRDDQGWQGRDDNDDDRWDGRDGQDGQWRDRRDGDRWQRGLVPVKFVNRNDRFVTLYLNGSYLGRVAPHSRERIWLPAGYHTVTYKVGWRHRFNQVTLTAFRGQKNRVVIDRPYWRPWW